MEKRVSARGIIIKDGFIYVMFRRKRKEDGSLREYYVIPGGGQKEGETIEECLIREMQEEFSVEVEIIDFLGQDESEETIANFFQCKIISGRPKLGGEELEKCNPENYYEIRRLPLEDLNKIDILPKEMIIKIKTLK